MLKRKFSPSRATNATFEPWMWTMKVSVWSLEISGWTMKIRMSNTKEPYFSRLTSVSLGFIRWGVEWGLAMANGFDLRPLTFDL